jgi:transposase
MYMLFIIIVDCITYIFQEWQDKQKKLKRSYKYVWNNTAFKDINPAETEYLFGKPS